MNLSFTQQLGALLDSGDLDAVIQKGEQPSPSSTPDPEVDALIATARRRKSLLERYATGTTSVSEIACASCKIALRVHSSSSQSVSCYGCGTITDIASLRASPVKVSAFEAPSALSVGLTGTFEGKSIQVLGRAAYQSTILEWDSEDSRYESESWSWVEWSIMTEDGELLYLSHDSDGYFLNRGHSPKYANLPSEITQEVDFSPGGDTISPRTSRITEWGQATILQAEGELSWTPERGETLGYAEYCSKGVTYGVEWRTPPGAKTPAEAEYYTAKKVSFETLLKMFTLPALMAEYQALKRYRFERLVWGVPFLILGLVLVGTCLVTSSSGERIFQSEVKHISALSAEGALFGPVTLDSPHSVYRFGFQASIPDNSDMWVGLELLDASQSPINGHDGDLWRESGYDDGEYYSESDLNRSQAFYLDEPGSYYLRLTREQDTSKPVDGSVLVYVDTNVVWSSHFMKAGILAVLVSLFVLPLTLPRHPRLD